MKFTKFLVKTNHVIYYLTKYIAVSICNANYQIIYSEFPLLADTRACNLLR